MKTEDRSKRKVKLGRVISNKMNKTVIVEVGRKIRHSRYMKIVRTRKNYYAHNENLDLETGDAVMIVETRPISKLKRWRVVEKLDKQATFA